MKIFAYLLLFFVFGLPALAGPVADISQVYSQKKSDVQVHGTGFVDKVLPDDNNGSRHQRFIIRLANSQTILVAHNIDLAPRINDLRAGDKVEFFGEYEWSEKGGTVHWTHRDPAGRHVSGWLSHNGRRYE